MGVAAGQVYREAARRVVGFSVAPFVRAALAYSKKEAVCLVICNKFSHLRQKKEREKARPEKSARELKQYTRIQLNIGENVGSELE